MGCSNSKTEITEAIKSLSEVSNQNYNKYKPVLIEIMNGYYENNEKSKGKKYVLTIGAKGSGKSTLAKILYGVNDEDCKVGIGNDDCTKEIYEFKTKFENLYLIDSIGITLVYENIAKLFILLISKQYFPDFIVLPGERTGDLQALEGILNLGILEILFVPFSPGSYHTALNFSLKNGKSRLEAEGVAFEMGLANELLRDQFISFNKNFKLYDLKSEPTIESNMKLEFFKHFYEDGKFKDIDYFDFIKKKSSTSSDSFIHYFYGCLLRAIILIPERNIDFTKKTLYIEDEVSYLSLLNRDVGFFK